MRNLGTYFKMWDDLVPKYRTVIKIKLIGDVFMAAAGIFDQDAPPSLAATDMVAFTVDGLRGRDDVNTQLRANLSVRIGNNTGGRLIVDVFGTDKPLFDIINDSINIATLLQSIDISNNVQISQATYDLVRK